ncbi:MAG: phosphoribosylanthranilate isomerase [Roseibium album]|nr:phosphoribosylanthranilate isomerase [Roseibium album]MBG6145540.1 phosphoribosylanthranilate isomerase [Labrenzia sp. EL_142]MBG6157766.1 phosphoribosylanthranilate isomerase [Labrenzia sp. EL_162]MBG6195841.1 phosphoribosylanthranilate isomerase [Labrenzia sp. EL_159]MBG6201266.1 phosphoribosylanthranilate isomerase [Labrenzia sp. EL_13]
MSDIQVKICGLSTEETMEAALDAGADMVGLMFFPKSPRHVSLSKACKLADMARGKAEIVAVTVNMDPDGLSRIRELVNPDMIQFHGSEAPEALAAAKVMQGTKVMKALSVGEREDLERARYYSIVADWILFDAKPPKDSELPGGNGVSYDWTLLKDLDLEKPFLLSGGLDPANVGDAIRQSGVKAVDVSSGVERDKGVKDSERIRAFVAAAKSA